MFSQSTVPKRQHVIVFDNKTAKMRKECESVLAIRRMAHKNGQRGLSITFSPNSNGECRAECTLYNRERSVLMASVKGVSRFATSEGFTETGTDDEETSEGQLGRDK